MLRLLSLSLLLAAPVFSQSLAVSGEIRHRTEFDDRDLAQAAEAATVHLLRTRLGLEARPAPRVRAFVQIQDARYFGGENPALALGTLDGDADQLDLHQAYFEADSLGGSPVSVRVGRQELAYGNQRLVGAVGWSNVGRAFDAARLRWAVGSVQADLVAAQLVTDAGASDPQSLVGAFASAALPATHGLEVTALLDRNGQPVAAGPDIGAPRRERFTLGARGHGTVGHLGYDVELYAQAGAMAGAEGAPRDDVRAWLGSAELSAVAGPVSIAAGATRLSGDDDPADGVDRRFDTLFATNHGFYGAMDYFPTLAGDAGLTDLSVRLAGAPAPGWRLSATGHAFSTSAGEARAIGRELDLQATTAALPGVGLGGGISVFVPADRLGGGTTAWGFLTSSVAF